MCVYTRMNFCLEHLDIPWGLRFPETGIKGSCDLPDVNGRDWTRVSEKTECALKQWAFLFSPYLSFWFRTLDSFTFISWRDEIFFKSFSSTVFFSFNLSLCIRMSIVWMLSYLVNTAKSNLIQVPQDLYQRIRIFPIIAKLLIDSISPLTSHEPFCHWMNLCWCSGLLHLLSVSASLFRNACQVSEQISEMWYSV